MNATNQPTQPHSPNLGDAFHAVLRTTSDWLNVPSAGAAHPQDQN